MNTNLVTSRRFAPLFWTQFPSAFNDNDLKNTHVFLILFQFFMTESAVLITLAGATSMTLFIAIPGGALTGVLAFIGGVNVVVFGPFMMALAIAY